MAQITQICPKQLKRLLVERISHSKFSWSSAVFYLDFAFAMMMMMTKNQEIKLLHLEHPEHLPLDNHDCGSWYAPYPRSRRPPSRSAVAFRNSSHTAKNVFITRSMKKQGQRRRSQYKPRRFLKDSSRCSGRGNCIRLERMKSSEMGIREWEISRKMVEPSPARTAKPFWTQISPCRSLHSWLRNSELGLELQNVLPRISTDSSGRAQLTHYALSVFDRRMATGVPVHCERGN